MATTEAKPAALSTLESFNPATGELVGTVPTITPDQVQGVVDDVARIQPAWAELPLKVRATYMRRAAEGLLDDIDEVAELLVREQGKPRAEAYTMELLPTVDALRWCAKEGPKILADEKVPMTQAFTLSKKGHFSYEPIGVVGVIAPWNYPWSIPFGEVAIALMAGNGVVLKPASLTPLLPGLHALQERPLLLRADRRGRRHRPLELPLVDPLRRGRDRADGRQRRRPQAGQPDAAAGRADRQGLREGGAARGPGPRGPRRRRRRRRAGEVERRQDLLHRLS
jgi:hypothetical protein